MQRKVGTKIFYCNKTGNILKMINDSFGCVQDYSFEECYEIYKDLNLREKETIGFIKLDYGVYEKISKGSTGAMVNLETKELEFSYDPLPEIPQEPNEIDVIKDKIDILNSQSANLLLDNAKKEIEISTLNTNLANVTLEVAKIKGGM